MVCNGCRKLFRLAPRGSYSCGEACDFDLCMDCSTCDKGHMLVNYKGLPEHYNPAYKYGVVCSRCKKRLDHGEINNFCRCNTCILVGYHNDKIQPGSCQMTVGKLADFLKESGI